MARFGHCTGNKRERTGSQDWYAVHFAAHLARIEAEWLARESDQGTCDRPPRPENMATHTEDTTHDRLSTLPGA